VNSNSRWQRFVAVLVPALFPPLQLLFFGPHTIYTGNQQEFSAPFWSLVVHLLPVLLVIAGAFALVGVLLPHRLFPYYVVGLVGIGVVLWIQGNLVVGDYGVLNGEEIDWSSQAWRTRHESALWALPIIGMAFSRRLCSTAVFAGRVVIALQLVLFGVTTAQADPEVRATWEGPPNATFQLSSKQNVFHLVLDGFQSDVFHDIIEADRDEMHRTFAGFTFFANHAGAFPTTIVSIPAMLTGQAYRNQEPMRRFISRQFRHRSLYGVMRAQGYQVDVISGLVYDLASASNYYRLPTPYVTYEAYTQFAGWQLADLSLFRHAPHLLKPVIYNEQSWRLQTAFGQKSADAAGRRHMPVNGQAFLNDFTTRMHIAHDRPLYKFIHVGVPHWPMALNADCTYTGGIVSITRDRYMQQARCAIKRVGEFLDKLRELGLYDSSLILVTSDHGINLAPYGFTGERDIFGEPLSALSGSALALLVVKPPSSHGPLRISGAPTSITDIPATVMETLGLKSPFPGTSALKVDERTPRKRAFAVYPPRAADWIADYFPYMDIFTIDGRVGDGHAWKEEDAIYAPDVDAGGRSRGMFRPERSSSGLTFRWSHPNAYLHAPSTARGMELTVRSVAATPQTVTVEMRGEILDRITLDDHEWRTIRYTITPRPKSASADSEWVTLRVDPAWRPPGDGRTLGIMTRDLKWLN
jgi:hypothetical protein